MWAGNANGAPMYDVSGTTGTILALDSDIPPNRQRGSFSAEGASLPG